MTPASQEELKARLVRLRQHLIELAEGMQPKDGRVIWFDADFLASIASSRARKWAMVKETLNDKSRTFVTGVVSFSGMPKSEIEFDPQLCVGPSVSTTGSAKELLEEVIRVAEAYEGRCVLVTGNLGISILAQSFGIMVIQPDHAAAFLGLEYGGVTVHALG